MVPKAKAIMPRSAKPIPLSPFMMRAAGTEPTPTNTRKAVPRNSAARVCHRRLVSMVLLGTLGEVRHQKCRSINTIDDPAVPGCPPPRNYQPCNRLSLPPVNGARNRHVARVTRFGRKRTLEQPLPACPALLKLSHVCLDTVDAPGHAPCSGTVRFSMICAKPLGISPGNWGGRRVRHPSRVELLCQKHDVVRLTVTAGHPLERRWTVCKRTCGHNQEVELGLMVCNPVRCDLKVRSRVSVAANKRSFCDSER